MMYALIAVVRNGSDSIILDCSADEDDKDSWIREFDASGYDLHDLGLAVPEKNGIYVWQGEVKYTPEHVWGTNKDPGPEWQGKWRLATAMEVKRFMRGLHVWDNKIGYVYRRGKYYHPKIRRKYDDILNIPDTNESISEEETDLTFLLNTSDDNK